MICRLPVDLTIPFRAIQSTSRPRKDLPLVPAPNPTRSGAVRVTQASSFLPHSAIHRCFPSAIRSEFSGTAGGIRASPNEVG